jgi:hypothetical protein
MQEIKEKILVGVDKVEVVEVGPGFGRVAHAAEHDDRVAHQRGRVLAPVNKNVLFMRACKQGKLLIIYLFINLLFLYLFIN